MLGTNLDQDGYPCPPLLEPLSFSEFELRHIQGHPDSTTRPAIFISYQDYLRDFRSLIGVGFKQWVNGSFTTKKTDPKDIDIINFISHDVITDSSIEDLAVFQTHGGSRDRYQVDAYIIPVYPLESEKYWRVTLLMANSWASKFGFEENTGKEKNVAQLLFTWLLCDFLRLLPVIFKI